MNIVRLIKYFVVVISCLIISFNYLSAQELTVMSVNYESFPDIVVKAAINGTYQEKDSILLTERDNPVPCTVELSGARDIEVGGKMYVFLVENSYFFCHRNVFPELKKSILEVGSCLSKEDDVNIMYFGFRDGLRFLNAGQTSDFDIFKQITSYNFNAQDDSTFFDNNLIKSLVETVEYCEKHNPKHRTVILTLVSRGLNLSNYRDFPEDFADRLVRDGIYLNVFSYNSEAQNVKTELQMLSQSTGGSFNEFSNSDLEPKLVQNIEKMGKASSKTVNSQIVISFRATQTGVNNEFQIKYGNQIVVCEYPNPAKIGFMGKYPQTIMLIISIILVLVVAFVYFRYRDRIIKRIDNSTQIHIDDIKRQNRILKQEIEKYKKHPLNTSHRFDNVYIEETLIGSGKIIPKLLIDDHGEQRAVNITKLTITIGRSEANDIVISNRTVSSHHATLTNEGGFFYITDNNSTNGIFVNDIRITKSKIQPKDAIRIGAVFVTLMY